MSNPILKPNDPRFTKPPLVDATGKNRFGDQEQAEAKEEKPADVFTVTPGSAGEQPYQPRFETTARSRGGVLLVVALLGVAGVAAGAASISGLLVTGWIFPLGGIVASAAAWLLAYSDLQEMKHGGRDPSGWVSTQLAMWLGIAGLVFCLAAVGAMIWWGLSLLPDMI